MDARIAPPFMEATDQGWCVNVNTPQGQHRLQIVSTLGAKVGVKLNGSPKTSVNTAVNTVLTHAPGKTRVYLQKTGYTREIPGSASMPRAPYSQGHCANCSAHRLLKYAHRTMCCRYKCQKAAAAQRQARLAGGGARSAASEVGKFIFFGPWWHPTFASRDCLID